MRRLLWPSLLFLSISWLFFIPIFNDPDHITGLIFLIMGIIFLTIGLLNRNKWKEQKPLTEKQRKLAFALVFLGFLIGLLTFIIYFINFRI